VLNTNSHKRETYIRYKYKFTHTYLHSIEVCFLSRGFSDDEISCPFMFRLLCCRGGNSAQPSTDNLRWVASDKFRLFTKFRDIQLIE